MKLSCDVCGGILQMLSDGQGAKCKTCGVYYPLDLLRSKLGLGPAVQQKEKPSYSTPSAIPPVAATPVVKTPVAAAPVVETPVAAAPVAKTPVATPPVSTAPQETPPVETPIVQPRPVVNVPQASAPVFFGSRAIVDEPAGEDVAHSSATAPAFAVEPAPKFADTPAKQTMDAPQFRGNFERFEMAVKDAGGKTVSGIITQGSIGIGENVFLNGDYSVAYKVYRFEGERTRSYAGKGERVRLCLLPENKKAFKRAYKIVGPMKPDYNAYRYHGHEAEYFADLLKAKFPEYDVDTDVAMAGVMTRASFMLFRNNLPVLAIFLCHSYDRQAYKDLCKVDRYLKKQSIGCTNFFTNYRNDADYVVSRIWKALGVKRPI